MEKDKKIFLKTYLEFCRKYGIPRLLFATAVIGSAIAFPPAVPAVIAAGVAISYVEYKKKNPKATFKHFTKSGLKKQRNENLWNLEKTNIGQLIMHTKKRIREHENRSRKGEVFQEAQTQPTAEEITKIKSTKIFSDKAQAAERLNHIRWVNIKKGIEN